MQTTYYQSEDGLETIAIMKDHVGRTSIGIARAGREDIKRGLLSLERGKDVAFGRALKALQQEKTFVEKNYLRAMFAPVISEEE